MLLNPVIQPSCSYCERCRHLSMICQHRLQTQLWQPFFALVAGMVISFVILPVLQELRLDRCPFTRQRFAWSHEYNSEGRGRFASSRVRISFCGKFLSLTLHRLEAFLEIFIRQHCGHSGRHRPDQIGPNSSIECSPSFLLQHQSTGLQDTSVFLFDRHAIRAC